MVARDELPEVKARSPVLALMPATFRKRNARPYGLTDITAPRSTLRP